MGKLNGNNVYFSIDTFFFISAKMQLYFNGIIHLFAQVDFPEYFMYIKVLA